MQNNIYNNSTTKTMKIRVLHLVLLLTISATIAAQQAGDTISLNTDESITPPQQQTWWNKKLLHKGYKGVRFNLGIDF